jgi:hypothetical protein
MSPREAAKLRVEWERRGNPPCDHPNLVQERAGMGMGTGDYICTVCGDMGWGTGWPEDERQELKEMLLADRDAQVLEAERDARGWTRERFERVWREGCPGLRLNDLSKVQKESLLRAVVAAEVRKEDEAEWVRQ